MLTPVGAILPLAVFGIRYRYAVVALVVVLLVLLLGGLAARRGRGQKLRLRELSAADRQRYADDFAAVERDFVDHPAQAAARARGLVEELMRRRGFPDRIEPGQRAADLSRHDRAAAKALESANARLGAAGGDTERLRLAVQDYRTVVQRLGGSPP
jgi:hypothetical protein